MLVNSSIRLDKTLMANASLNEGLEESAIQILIKGSDTSGMKRDLLYQITSLPQNGVLFEPESQHIIKAGEVLNQTDSYPWSGMTINYVGNKNFFTSPHTWVNLPSELPKYESFAFVIVANVSDKANDTIGISSPVQNNISIVNINDPPSLEVPSSVQPILQFTALNWESNCNKIDQEERYQSSLSDEQCTNDHEINGITIDDADKGIDFVRVDVKSKFGILSLNQDNLLNAEFSSCSDRNSSMSQWNCVGTGIGDTMVRNAFNIYSVNTLILKAIVSVLQLAIWKSCTRKMMQYFP